jgi:ferredoxin
MGCGNCADICPAKVGALEMSEAGWDADDEVNWE